MGGIAHLADIDADQGARQRRLAVVGVGDQGELDIGSLFAHGAAETVRPVPSSSGYLFGCSRLTSVALVRW
jgi:hypothetical protein